MQGSVVLLGESQGGKKNTFNENAKISSIESATANPELLPNEL
jgi:hypothetical protein